MSPTSSDRATSSPPASGTPDGSAGSALAAPRPPASEDKQTVVAAAAGVVAQCVRVNRFRGRAMILEQEPYPHFTPLYKSHFDALAYPLLGGLSRSRISDIFAYLGNTAEDLTGMESYILFGLEDAQEGYYHQEARTVVWDMWRLEMREDIMPRETVWRSPYGAIGLEDEQVRVPFVMQLAGGDTGLYDDIMQSIAPMIMARKPDGVIWWVGDGANGKSTLMDALYRIFPGQFSSITVKRLADGRDTPSLNGTLANVVKESSEGRIEDTEIYKAVGTHENFRVHKFHSQDDIEIRGNIHHIFSANNVPVFNDKGYSARRRTFIVPFGQRFESDPAFEARTFTTEMFGMLITEMCRYAKRIAAQGYRYKWSATTLSAKADYDVNANNAEEYVKELITAGVVAFDSYNQVRIDYENWCADNGYVPLGLTNLRRAISNVGFERMSVRIGEAKEGVAKVYRLMSIDAAEALQQLHVTRPGLYTTFGFVPQEKPPVPDFEKQAEKQAEERESILKGEW